MCMRARARAFTGASACTDRRSLYVVGSGYKERVDWATMKVDKRSDNRRRRDGMAGCGVATHAAMAPSRSSAPGVSPAATARKCDVVTSFASNDLAISSTKSRCVWVSVGVWCVCVGGCVVGVCVWVGGSDVCVILQHDAH
jgi:hypothetical protein